MQELIQILALFDGTIDAMLTIPALRLFLCAQLTLCAVGVFLLLKSAARR